MIRVPTNRRPTHPGEMLREEFLRPMGVSQRALADSVQVPYSSINGLVNERRALTPALSLRLAKFLGTSPGFWMKLQMRYDLYMAQRNDEATLSKIQMHGDAMPVRMRDC